MATITSTSLSPAASSGHIQPLAGLKSFWKKFFGNAFYHYRPELHYMPRPGLARQIWRTSGLPAEANRSLTDLGFRLDRSCLRGARLRATMAGSRTATPAV